MGCAKPMAIAGRNRLTVLLLWIAACAPAMALTRTTLQAYTAHLETIRGLLTGCRANAAACHPDQVGDDEQVDVAGLNSGANIGYFAAQYDWVRNALREGCDAKLKNRDRMLAMAIAHADEALAEMRSADTIADDTAAMSRARASALAILEGREFRTIARESIWDRIVAWIYLWLDRLFGNVAAFGKRSPWIGPVFEIALVAAALVGLALWAMRVLQRQRLRVKLEAARQADPWEEASRNWRAAAAEEAARQRWREAVHSLYWASIVMLEGRRFWAPSRSRTPREYLQLLENGTPRWTLLQQQTQRFERIWYGLQPADAADYKEALHWHEQLRTA